MARADLDLDGDRWRGGELRGKRERDPLERRRVDSPRKQGERERDRLRLGDREGPGHNVERQEGERT